MDYALFDISSYLRFLLSARVLQGFQEPLTHEPKVS